MTTAEEITKDLEKFRNWQIILMVASGLASACGACMGLLGNKDAATLSTVLGALCAFGATYFGNKTNGISRNLILENNKLANENIRLSTEIKGLTSGGDSFGYLTIIPENDKISVTFWSWGEYPLYNVSIRIFDNTNNQSSNRHFVMTSPTFTIEEVNSRQYVKLGTIPFATRDNYDIKIYCEARNQRWCQQHKIVRTPELDLQANAKTYYQKYTVYSGNTFEGKELFSIDGQILVPKD
ncbi:hypothetical protein [Spirosoma panaciterrae]|uniref:hypothetical protein n=1 Tax=Spirosoma panaciterrae TaxID=496058 RepID=UPI00036DACB0|nr:hypothetical protein [Spirosoma panaciterrae]